MRGIAAMIFPFVFLCAVSSYSNDSVQSGIENIFFPKYSGKGIGVVIKDLDRDSVMVSINRDGCTIQHRFQSFYWSCCVRYSGN